MASSRFTVAVLLLACSGVAGILAACSDTVPHYGAPDGIRGRMIDYGTPAMMTTPPASDGGTTTMLTPQQAFHAVYMSVSGSCGTCHLSGTPAGAPVFFGADEATTYTKFKAAGYDKAGSRFYIKPAHTGPALTAAQKKLMDAWIAAEAAGGGTTTPMDAGGD